MKNCLGIIVLFQQISKILTQPSRLGKNGRETQANPACRHTEQPRGSKSSPTKRATELLEQSKLEIVDSIPDLCQKDDAVLLESVDGCPHWEHVKPVLAARKPVFMDKPTRVLYGCLEQFNYTRDLSL
jgi:hypothetical protein